MSVDILSRRARGRSLVTFVVLALGAGGLVACSPTDEPTGGSSSRTDELSVLVANYDLSVERPQRMLVGLVTGDQRLVSFGQATFRFAFLGRDGATDQPVTKGDRVRAQWSPIPGQDLGTLPTTPRVVDGSDGTGVYIAPDVKFDKAGYWQLEVEGSLRGGTRRGEASFVVAEVAAVVDVGDPAPLTVNQLPGAVGIAPKAIDSRASPDGAVPDPALHRVTVAEALRSGRPTIVVVSTPVYCVSRFCGPITDFVAELAETYRDRANFVHIEVWSDFQTNTINKAAADWMFPDGAEDAFEPWVWLVDSDGVVSRRWDNVATASDVTAALAAEVG